MVFIANFFSYCKNSIFKRNILVILLLGCSSGGPIYLLSTSLKEFLISSDVDLKTIGFYSLVFTAYSIKFLWSPLIDSIKIPILYQKFGQRRSWLLASQISLILAISILSFTINVGNIYTILLVAILVSIVSATQDLAVDAYRIEYVKKTDQPLSATAYVTFYRIAGLATAAIVILVEEVNLSWSSVLIISTIPVWIGILATIVGEDIYPKDPEYDNFFTWFKIYVKGPIMDFISNHKWYIIFPFIFCFKLCDSMAGVMTHPFVRDIGFSYKEYFEIVKAFGLIAIIFGSLLGVLIARQKNLVYAIWIALFMQILSNYGFYLQSIVGMDYQTLYLVIFVENFSGGMGDVILISYLSSLCNKAFSATQYSLLFALASFSRTIFGSFSGLIAEQLNWGGFFILSMVIGIPAIILLYFVTKNYDFKRR
ncbi:MAG: PAT family beta-lactamase induction signal transducer AmpG [Rickettsiales bacterium]|jgi:PAT family beta-lactamase induction signal transducer AmpG